MVLFNTRGAKADVLDVISEIVLPAVMKPLGFGTFE